MSLESTLDLLYLIIAISVLWVAAMLTWLLFEAAKALSAMNRFLAIVHKNVSWLDKKVSSIGDRIESSSMYIDAIAKGGRALVKMMQERKAAQDAWDDEDDEPVKKRRRTTRKR